MLRHLLVMPMLLLCLLCAGVPAHACGAVTTHHCCPDGPSSPCQSRVAGTAAVNRLDSCCIAGGAVAAMASAVPSSERGKQADGAAPPTLLELPSLTTAYVQAEYGAHPRSGSPPRSDSTLFLSTGRLRL